MQSITIDTSSKCNTPNSRCSPITSSPSDGGTPNSGTDDLNNSTDEYSIYGRNPHYTTTSKYPLPSNRTQKSSFITQTQTVRLPLPSEDSFKACIFDRKIVFYAVQDDCSKLENKEFSSFKEFSKKFNPNETNSKKRKHMTNEPKKINNGMYLHYLLPLITMCESPTHFQYEQIDNFLMPIWKFNQITAKGLLNKQEMQQYIDIIKGKVESTTEFLDNIARQLFEKKPKSLGLNKLKGTYDDNQ